MSHILELLLDVSCQAMFLQGMSHFILMMFESKASSVVLLQFSSALLM
jgi:hypothetical protein